MVPHYAGQNQVEPLPAHMVQHLFSGIRVVIIENAVVGVTDAVHDIHVAFLGGCGWLIRQQQDKRDRSERTLGTILRVRCGEAGHQRTRNIRSWGNNHSMPRSVTNTFSSMEM